MCCFNKRPTISSSQGVSIFWSLVNCEVSFISTLLLFNNLEFYNFVIHFTGKLILALNVYKVFNKYSNSRSSFSFSLIVSSKLEKLSHIFTNSLWFLVLRQGRKIGSDIWGKSWTKLNIQTNESRKLVG